MPLTNRRRQRVTVLAYAGLGAYAYCLYALGPLLALLRDDLGLSYTVLSLHSSLWALGTVATGLFYHRFASALGRGRLFWVSAAGTVAGALLFVGGYAVGVTLLAAAVLGTAGSFLQTGTVAMLADEYAEETDRALMGANVVASATAVVAPVVLGLLAGTVVGWRVGMLAAVMAVVVLRVKFGHDDIYDGAVTAERGGSGSLPVQYWVAATMVAVVVGVEFVIVFHGAGLMRQHNGMSAGEAATAMSVFYVAELAGRLVGTRVTRTPGRAAPLTVVALGVTAAGFGVFWQSAAPALALAGLAVAGLGVANLYPLTLALAMRAAPGRADTAAGRTQLFVGSAVLVAPLALGALADRIGVQHAYTVEPVLLVVAATLLAVLRRIRPGTTAALPAPDLSTARSGAASRSGGSGWS